MAPKRTSLATAWQLPALAAALTVLVLVVTAVFPKGRIERTPHELLYETEQRLSRNQHDAAKDLAKAFLRTYEAPTADRALAHFYCGRALREGVLAEDVPPRDVLREAAAQFDYACTLPLPAEAREWAYLWGGDCLERLGQPAEAAGIYLQGLSLKGPIAGTIRLALLRVWSKSDRPDLERINEQLEGILEDPHLGASEKAAALVAAGDVAYRLERWDEAERWFAQVTGRFPDAGAAGRAHLRLARLAHAKGRYPQALAEAQAYLASAGRRDRDAVTAAFVLADALLQTGNPAEALNAFRQLGLDFPLDPEGQAAGLREVACHLRLERGPEALARLKTLLAEVPLKQWSRNPWISEADARALVDELRRFFFVREQYGRVLELAYAARLLLPTTYYLETLATAHRLVAEQEERLAQAGGPEEAEHRERARRARIQAGDALASLAEATKTERVFVEHLWSAVECYRKAPAYRRAARTLETFIESRFGDTAPQGQRHAQASYYLGECYAALGRPAEAVELFEGLVRRYPRNAYAYLARLAWAECCLTQNRLDEAETVLLAVVDNTEGDLIGPRSMVWQRAIFLLGEVLHRGGKHGEAIPRLMEAVERFPHQPEAQRGRYLLAECHRASALAAAKAIKEETRPAVRAALEAQRRARLSEAVALYRKVVDQYDAQEAQGERLDALDETQRCNSAFFLGGCYFEMEQYGQAIAAYEQAAFRYKDDPRSVSAFVQISEALRRQRKAALARAAAERGLLMLNRLPGDDLAKRPAGMTKQQWTAWLHWASRLE